MTLAAFVLGMVLIFVPMDILLKISRDVEFLIFDAGVIGLLIRLRYSPLRVRVGISELC